MSREHEIHVPVYAMPVTCVEFGGFVGTGYQSQIYSQINNEAQVHHTTDRSKNQSNIGY